VYYGQYETMNLNFLLKVVSSVDESLTDMFSNELQR